MTSTPAPARMTLATPPALVSAEPDHPAARDQAPGQPRPLAPSVDGAGFVAHVVDLAHLDRAAFDDLDRAWRAELDPLAVATPVEEVEPFGDEPPWSLFDEVMR